MRVLSLLVPPLCVACRSPCRHVSPLCPACIHALDRLGGERVALRGVRVWAPLAYEGPARAVVRRHKFHGAIALADHMAAAIVANAPTGLLDHALVPVPSAPARRRRRGFCHATALAQAIAARTGLPVVALLDRVGPARPQVGRPRAQRLRSPPRFRVVQAHPGPVVIVDDVVTTGATVGACAHSLREAGCTCEQALAYARTPVR